MKTIKSKIIAAVALLFFVACAKLPEAKIPDGEQIKADLIGKEIGEQIQMGSPFPVWEFRSLSEFQEFTVKDKQIQGAIAEYSIFVRLQDAQRGRYQADVSVSYRKQEGKWTLVSLTANGTLRAATP